MAGGGKGSLDRRKYAADALRAARKSKSNDFLDRLDGCTGRPRNNFYALEYKMNFPHYHRQPNEALVLFSMAHILLDELRST